MTHHGSCHCGAVAFDLEGEVGDAIDCNCSMCRRRGGLLAFFPREALTLTTPESNYGTYRFNKAHLAHHFCPTCGVAPFSERADPRTGRPDEHTTALPSPMRIPYPVLFWKNTTYTTEHSTY